MHGQAAGVRLGGGRMIEGCLKESGETIEGWLVRARHSDRRHQSHSNFSNDFLPGLGALRNVGKIGMLERKPTGPGLVAVAGDAMSIDDRSRFQLLWRGRRLQCECSQGSTCDK